MDRPRGEGTAHRTRPPARWRLISAAPPVPAEIADALRLAQIDSLKTQVPVLLAVAGLNTALLIAVCAHSGLPLSQYGWLTLLILYVVLRGQYLRRQFARAASPARQHRMVRTVSRAAILMLAVLGVTAGATFATGLFDRSLLVPMSLGFGAISIAHCLYRVRRVALGAIGLGIGPSGGMLILVGNFEAQMLGLSMISVGLLMMRFVAAQYDQLIDNLVLQHQIRVSANSDPLTGLANRRAIGEFLAGRPGLAGVGLALIDLDDFKLINDQHGHDVGDALLVEVAARLTAALPAGGLAGRLGGDEFIAVLPGLADDMAMGAVATRLLAALARPVQIGALTLPVGASIGHALGGPGERDPAALTKRADEALYAAKALGKGQGQGGGQGRARPHSRRANRA